MKKDTITIDDLMEKVDSYIKDPKEREKILDAYYYAKEKHAGQYRKSGEEYIIHPLSNYPDLFLFQDNFDHPE